MSFPPGVQLREVTFGVPFALANGDDLVMEVTFTPTRSMVWAATGAPAIARGFKATNSVGLQGSISVPVTDQAGWLDGNGGALSVAAGAQTHLYVVDILYKDQSGTIIAKAPTRNLPLPAGDLSPVDLDLLIPVSTTAGVALSIPDTWSTAIAAAQAAADAAQAAASAALAAVADFIVTDNGDGTWNIGS